MGSLSLWRTVKSDNIGAQSYVELAGYMQSVPARKDSQEFHFIDNYSTPWEM